MSTRTLYAMSCDECDVSIYPQGDEDEARWVAQEIGWLIDRNGDYCPACRILVETPSEPT